MYKNIIKYIVSVVVVCLGLLVTENVSANCVPKVLYKDSIHIVSNNQTGLYPLREVCDIIGYNVRWDNRLKKAYVRGTGAEYYVRNSKIVEGVTYVTAEELSKYVKELSYNEEYNIIMVGNSYKGDELVKKCLSIGGYTKTDMEWLGKIVSAEARGEEYYSKIAVANVILNRVEHYQYPDTIKGVIFDKKSGVQFTPTVNGQINKTATQESVYAAFDALCGYDNSGGALFFINPKIASKSWVSRNRTYIFSMGNHAFYM